MAKLLKPAVGQPPVATKEQQLGTFRALCRAASVRVIPELIKIAGSDASPSDRVAAIKLLIEQGYGKPVVPLAIGSADERQSFVIKAPPRIADAASWERTVDLERAEYEHRASAALDASASPAMAEDSSVEVLSSAPKRAVRGKRGARPAANDDSSAEVEM